MIQYADTERPTYEEYIDFLRACDLGSQYPKQDFARRIPLLLQNASLCITARDESKLIGVALGVTDFVYFMFLTDLGVDRAYVGQGIGKALLVRAHARAGGEANITLVTLSNENARGFYRAFGMKADNDLFVKYCRDWESFDVRDL